MNPSKTVSSPLAPLASQPNAAAGPLMPPSDAQIPSPPEGFIPTNPSDYNGLRPMRAEQVALAAAIADLERFGAYTTRLGPSAPPQDHLLKLLAAGAAWTTMHNRNAAWDAYCVTQEGLAWTALAGLMQQLRDTYRLALRVDPELASEVPGLHALLGARRAMARRAASTRAANVAAKAQGELPTHGAAGKRRKRAAERAAYALAQSPAEPSGGTSSALPGATTGGATSASE